MLPPLDGISLDRASQNIGNALKKRVRVAEGILHNALRAGFLIAWGDFFDQDFRGVKPIPSSTWCDITTKQFHSYTIGCCVPQSPLAQDPHKYGGFFKNLSISQSSIESWLGALPNIVENYSVETVKSWLIEQARKDENKIPTRDEGWALCQRYFGPRKVNNLTFRDAFKEVRDMATSLSLIPPTRGRKRNSEKRR